MGKNELVFLQQYELGRRGKTDSPRKKHTSRILATSKKNHWTKTQRKPFRKQLGGKPPEHIKKHKPRQGLTKARVARKNGKKKKKLKKTLKGRALREH